MGGVAVQKGFSLTNEYEVAVSTNQDAFRSGVGVGDKFYAPNIRENKVYVYDKDGNVSTITPPKESMCGQAAQQTNRAMFSLVLTTMRSTVLVRPAEITALWSSTPQPMLLL